MASSSWTALDPAELTPREAYALMTQVIVPRPIAWVSTLSREGVRNLAPFSFFNGVSARPPIVSVAVGRTRDGDKDTTRNVRETREFVVNVVDRACAEAMVASSGSYPPEADEFEIAGVTALPSTRVAPPRVAESPVHLECEAVEVIDRPGGAEVSLLLGRVLCAHVADRLAGGDEIDPRALDPVARLGGPHYAALGELFDLPRPD